MSMDSGGGGGGGGCGVLLKFHLHRRHRRRNKSDWIASCSLALAAVVLLGRISRSDCRIISKDGVCEPYEFQCLHLNLNQILSINDWNRRPKECIPQSYRCDGRHDCQDGSDEVECFVQLPRRKTFRCFVGEGTEMVVEDCIERDRRHPMTDPRETSRSVSEMKEWTCSKIDRPDGRVIRDCTRLYTGGTLFRVCYTNSHDGSTCICSGELCNGGDGGVSSAGQSALLVTLIALAAVAL